MTFEEVETLIKGISYKPGWKIECLRSSSYGPYIDIRIMSGPVPDALGINSFAQPIQSRLLLSDQLPAPFFLQEIFKAIRVLELHEMDEWLKYQGKWVRDPHPEISGDRNLVTVNWETI